MKWTCYAVFSVILLQSISNAAPTAPTQALQPQNTPAFDILAKSFRLDTNLKSLITLTATSKYFEGLNASKAGGYTSEEKKEIIEKVFQQTKLQWEHDFEKTFSKKEQDYLKTIFAHRLLARFSEFNERYDYGDDLLKSVETRLAGAAKKRPAPAVTQK